MTLPLHRLVAYVGFMLVSIISMAYIWFILLARRSTATAKFPKYIAIYCCFSFLWGASGLVFGLMAVPKEISIIQQYFGVVFQWGFPSITIIQLGRIKRKSTRKTIVMSGIENVSHPYQK